jgi:hypothetical protein
VPFASQVQLADTSLAGEQLRATLLQQALPQIPAAIYSCRDALLAQGAQLNILIQSVLDNRLARVEGTLNCLVQCQLGAAQQLAEQLQLFGIDAVQQLQDGAAGQPGASSSTAFLQPSSPSLCAGPPAYTLITAYTVTDVWREYKEGIARGPAVEQLERDWQSRWRPAAAQRTAWSWRKTIVNEVQSLVATGLAPAAAVAELEARRGSSTLRSLIDALVEERRQPSRRRRAGRQALQ